jgi:hypothetical protein
MRQGYGGDPLSAVLVAEYFAWQRPPDKRADEKWRLIAAENGDLTAAVSYAKSLELIGGEEHCLRAKFWLERAALQLQRMPRSPNVKEVDPARAVGLLTLRDHWQQCLDGKASGYIGVTD